MTAPFLSFSLCPAFNWSRARGIQGASLSERREKRHLCQSREILGRDHLLCSGVATSHSQVILSSLFSLSLSFRLSIIAYLASMRRSGGTFKRGRKIWRFNLLTVDTIGFLLLWIVGFNERAMLWAFFNASIWPYGSENEWHSMISHVRNYIEYFLFQVSTTRISFTYRWN